ncbi:hypothetical protein [Halosimplex amylolyticum]
MGRDSSPPSLAGVRRPASAAVRRRFDDHLAAGVGPAVERRRGSE